MGNKYKELNKWLNYMPKQIIYNDIDIRFIENPYTKDVTLLKDEDAISRSIKNLVFTNMYERPYKVSLFSDTLASLFENFSILEANILQQNITDVINRYEPRAVLINVIVRSTPDENRVEVVVIYRPINSKKTVEINIFLERIR